MLFRIMDFRFKIIVKRDSLVKEILEPSSEIVSGTSKSKHFLWFPICVIK